MNISEVANYEMCGINSCLHDESKAKYVAQITLAIDCRHALTYDNCRRIMSYLVDSAVKVYDENSGIRLNAVHDIAPRGGLQVQCLGTNGDQNA